MSRLGGRQRDPHGFRIAHLSNDNDVGSLPHGGPQRRGKIGRIHTDFHLLDHTALVVMLVFNWILDRDDVSRLASVDVVDQRGERRRLPRASRTADEHEAARKMREQLHRRRKPERAETRHALRQQSNGCRASPPFAVQVDAEPPHTGHSK